MPSDCISERKREEKGQGPSCRGRDACAVESCKPERARALRRASWTHLEVLGALAPNVGRPNRVEDDVEGLVAVLGLELSGERARAVVENVVGAERRDEVERARRARRDDKGTVGFRELDGVRADTSRAAILRRRRRGVREQDGPQGSSLRSRKRGRTMKMRFCWPFWSLAVVTRAQYAVRMVRGNVAASSSETFAGFAASVSFSTATYSANAPLPVLKMS